MFDDDDPKDEKSTGEDSEQSGDAISDDQLDEIIGAGEYWGGGPPNDGC